MFSSYENEYSRVKSSGCDGVLARVEAEIRSRQSADSNQSGVKAKPGQRDALISLIEHIMTDGPPMPGSLGATLYKSVDDPDLLVGIVDWEPVEAREAVMTTAEASGAFTPVFELLAAPFKAAIVEPLD